MSRDVSRAETEARTLFASPASGDPGASYALARRLREEDNNLEYSRRVLAIAYEKRMDAPEPLQFQIVRDLVLCTYKSPDLPPDERFKRAEKLAQDTLDSQDLSDDQRQDLLGITGAIWKQRWRVYGLREHLERALSFYEKGMALGVDRDRGYTAINAAFVLDLLARAGNVMAVGSLKSKAQQIRENVRDVLLQLLKGNAALSEDFWFLGTLGEAYLGLGDFDQAIHFMTLAGQRVPELWKVESTARQSAEVARFMAADAEIALEEIATSKPWAAVQALVGGDSAAAMSFLLGKVGLALSGGGFRASLFHIGVLARLAELDMLRHVEVLSCVSGGSIVGAYYYLELRKKLQEKPDRSIDGGEALEQQDYIDVVSNLEHHFLSGVQRNIRLRMLMEFGSNLRVLMSRSSSMTERLARIYDRELYASIEDEFQGRRRRLCDLLIQPKGALANFHPKYENWIRRNKVPILILNSTTLNTCHNWQFTGTFMGEPPARGIQVDIDANDRFRRMYHTEAPPGFCDVVKNESGVTVNQSKLKLSEAVAASACVPALFDPLVLDDLYGTAGGAADVTRYIPRLVDGGAYDNQGVSSLLEQDCTVLLVSDACGQTGVAIDPGGSRVEVMQRANNVLMARVREAQYQQMASLRDANVLKGLMYVHLKKELESTQIDWIGCPDRSSAAVPADRTSYGIRREIQLAIARIRTDLDSFSDCEADALMLSGYRMTNNDFAQCIHGFPVHDVGPRPWRFRQIEQIATAEAPTPDTKKLQRALGVAENVPFKPWRASRILQWILGICGVIALAGIAFLSIHWWNTEIRWRHPVHIGKAFLIFLTIIAALSLIRWTLTGKMRYRNSFGQILTSALMCAVGWIVLQIHLRFIEPFYLRYGPKYRVRVH